MSFENSNRPPIREVFGPRLCNKIRAYGERIGLSEDAVIDRITTQYPNLSVNELSAEIGLVKKTTRKLLQYAGVRILSVSESVEINKEHRRGFFGLTKEERSRIGAEGGRRSAKLGTGIHGFNSEQRSEAGKKGGSIAGKKALEKGIGIFAMTKEQKHDASVKAGKTSFERRAGFHSFSPEQRREQGHRAGIRLVELGAGIHGLSDERRKEIAREAGRKSAEMGAGAHGIDLETGEKIAVRAGRRSLELRAGIHKQTPEDHLRIGLQASEVMSSLKVLYEGNYYDSRVEAAAAVSLERYIPGFQIDRGVNYQVVIPEVLKKVDFAVNDTLVEYNPIILWYSNGYLGSFDTKEEFDAYLTHRNSLPDSERTAYMRQVIEELRQKYHKNRRTAIDENPDYRDKELIVVINPDQLYRDVITRFGQNYPATQEEFVRFFRSTLRLVEKSNKQKN